MLKAGSRNYFSILWVCFILYNNRRGLPEHCCNTTGLVPCLWTAWGSDKFYKNKLNYSWSDTMTQLKAQFWPYFCWNSPSRKKISHSFPTKMDWLCSKRDESFSVLAHVEPVPAHWNCQQQKAALCKIDQVPMGLMYYCKPVNSWQWGTW